MQAFPIFPIMFLIFLTLKLCSVIDWSWWWVTAPLWGGFVIGVLFFGGAAIVFSVKASSRRP